MAAKVFQFCTNCEYTTCIGEVCPMFPKNGRASPALILEPPDPLEDRLSILEDTISELISEVQRLRREVHKKRKHTSD